MAALALIALLIVLAKGVYSVQIISDAPSSFAFADSRHPQFVVALEREGLSSSADDGPTAAATIMTDSKGQRYACRLPDAAALSVGPATNLQEDLEQADSKTPFELLEKLHALCLYRQEGLWTYEVCHKKQVRQFRQESSGKGEEFSCGKYIGDRAQVADIQGDSSASSIPIKYVSHRFEGGAKCTMTGATRSTEVRFTCLPHTSDNMITAVKEFPTCNYIITVSTPFLCKHPAFMPPPDNLHGIICQPLPAHTAPHEDGFAPSLTATPTPSTATASDPNAPTPARDEPHKHKGAGHGRQSDAGADNESGQGQQAEGGKGSAGHEDADEAVGGDDPDTDGDDTYLRGGSDGEGSGAEGSDNEGYVDDGYLPMTGDGVMEVEYHDDEVGGQEEEHDEL